jgi:hypothetical protein
MGVIKRRTGVRDVRVFDAAGTIVAGDSVQLNESGEVLVGATSAEILGIALDGATASTTCTVDILKPGDECEFPVETGSMAASEIGNEADLASEDGLTMTESNNDVLVTGWDGVTTTKLYGVFKNLAFGA